jgi:hypothetical protein
MLGFPTETEDEMRATIDFNLSSAAHVTHFFVVTPYEGTTMHQELERWGIHSEQLDDELLGFQNFSGSDEHGSISPVPRSKIQGLIVEGVQRFFFDPRRLARMIELSHNPVPRAAPRDAPLVGWLRLGHDPRPRVRAPARAPV